MQWRREFFKQNPIPGCIIVNDVLTNPDDVMIQQYETDELLSDIRSVGALTPVMQKIAPKYVRTLCRWDEVGQKGLLVSSCMETLRQEPRNIGEELQQYYTRCNVIGDSKERWATEDLVAADKLTAPVTLIGELPLYTNLEKPLFSFRTKEITSKLSYNIVIRGYHALDT